MNDTAISLRLGAWWEANARDLPWRFGRATPWGVLVSEVMSQQTQMSRVVPYWTDWMARWPDARALAEAPKAEVITAWGRLGYPRRALRLQECARVVAEDYADKLPRTYDELTALPGIGDYTASAVMSFAFGERIAVIDTNIRRVLSRVFLGVESRGGATSPAERALANRMLPKDEILGCDADVADNAGSAEHVVNSTIRGGKRSRLHRGERPSVTWNQSVMELGAVICRPSRRCATPARLRTTVHFSRPAAPDWGSAAPAHANDSKARIDRCAVWCSPRCASFPLEPRCPGKMPTSFGRTRFSLPPASPALTMTA
ncbi:A G-specific adenine DNA glycosylase [Bifidobacterium longum subsp. longum]|nr:A/G-specific adenine DNA glycosylase [Bifidobacterium longum subsp. longum]